MTSETIADRIKAIRTAAGDNLSEAGKKVGVSRQAFDKWEKGDTENMKLGNLLRFCDRYRVNLEALIRGDGDIWKPPGAGAGTPVIIAFDKAAEPDSEKYDLTPDQKTLLSAFNVAGHESRRILLQIAEGIIQDFEKRSETN